jgi:hypothetical protein
MCIICVLICVHAGEVTKRGAAIALMILIVFPDASPISEKLLRLFRHIRKECLPSEQMHHSYSIISTSKSAFSLLSKEEPALYAHIQKVFEQPTDVVSDDTFQMQSNVATGKCYNAEVMTESGAVKRIPLRPPPPGVPSPSYVLLHPWLETGELI